MLGDVSGVVRASTKKRRRFLLTFFGLMLCSQFLSFHGAVAAQNGIFVYGCTSDGKPARMRVRAPLSNKVQIESAFRQFIGGKTSAWFLSQKKATDFSELKDALQTTQRLSGNVMPDQNPSLVARSVEIGKRAISAKIYCGL